MFDQRGVLTKAIADTEALERSPFVRGLTHGAKGALIGGAAGAILQGLRGKSPVTGALVAGLGTGLLMGLTRAVDQDIANKEQEGQLRYYLEQMKEQEPTVFMPPPPVFGRIFTSYHRAEHADSKK